MIVYYLVHLKQDSLLSPVYLEIFFALISSVSTTSTFRGV